MDPPKDPEPPAPEPPEPVAPIIQEPITQESITDEPEPADPVCGPGTFLADDGTCTPVPTDGGGCPVATAAYGTDVRAGADCKIRDGALSTGTGSAFVSGFNRFYAF